MTRRDWVLVISLTAAASFVGLATTATLAVGYRNRHREAKESLANTVERLDSLERELNRLDTEEDRSREIALDAFSLAACGYDRVAPTEGRSPGPPCHLSVLFSVRDGERSSHHLLANYPPENDGRSLSPDPSIPVRISRRSGE